MDYVVAVRTLCEFTAKRGDLDLRFTPAPTALEGMAGHAAVAGRRKAGYESELTLSGTYQDLLVRGRADGYDPVRCRLEEIKTYRGKLEAIPDNHRTLHWAQACIYGHLLCRQRGFAELTVALVYFEIGSQHETILERPYSATALEAFFNAQCADFLDWAKREQTHRLARDVALSAMPFPHATFRDGQRQLSVAVYRAARDAACLMAQAPTGIGKTVGTLFPLLKACPETQLDKIFFLTAKGSGRALALDALELLHHKTPSLPLRILELTARDKACEHPDKACHGESCPLARGFYDRLPQARSAALEISRLDRDTLRETALAHGICPYYLAQELVRWSDVVIGDYNYYFDSSALLYGLAQTNQWRVGVLVDEAHNLVDRAREMYTSTLPQSALQSARNMAPKELGRALALVNRHWNALNREQTSNYQVHETPPSKLLGALQKALGLLTEHRAQSPLVADDALLRFYFEALYFTRLAEQFGPHSIFDVTLQQGRGASPSTVLSTLCLRNVVPATFLAERYAFAHVTVLFSGTLAPFGFYQDTLGLPASTTWLEVGAPFNAAQLTVRIVGGVSTRFRDRERSLQPIADLIATQYAAKPGNYLGFFSSFDYLQRVVAMMRERHPSVPIWSQVPGMTDPQRQDFLARFTLESQGVGFAVLGGAFSEGVDLPGARLIGAFIATLGLPQINEVNEQMRLAMNTCFGDGYKYMYLYPGLRKVVQAAGRVIRSEHDTGTLHLIDDRYRQREVQQLLPSWWRLTEDQA